jgi:hypothetical protein
MDSDEKNPRGRPENKARTEKVTLPVDPATLRMLDSLSAYGRFGVTRPDVVLTILRMWLWDNESRLREGILSSSKPFGVEVEPAQEEEDKP